MVSSKKSKTTKNKKSAKTKTTTIKTNVKGKEKKPLCHKILMAFFLILLPVVVGLISSALTGEAMMKFKELNQPPLAPPAWLFPVAWTILYILMGVASYLIYRIKTTSKEDKKLKVTELVIYFVQLAFNFMWTIFFFKLEFRFFAFGWLIAMWLMIAALIVMASKNSKATAWLLVPYILWCTFAAYLNIAIAILN